MNLRIDDATIDKVVAAYEKGDLKKDIAAQYGLGVTTVTKVLRLRGVDRSPKKAGDDTTYTFLGVTETLRYFAKNWCFLNREEPTNPAINKAVKTLRARLDTGWLVDDAFSTRAGSRRPDTSRDTMPISSGHVAEHRIPGMYIEPGDLPPIGPHPIAGGPFHELTIIMSRLI